MNVYQTNTPSGKRVQGITRNIVRSVSTPTVTVGAPDKLGGINVYAPEVYRAVFKLTGRNGTFNVSVTESELREALEAIEQARGEA
jgi:hypothetical protein